jgi:phosphoglucosamine mutase
VGKRRYFGTDGIRGRVGVEPITPDFVLKLGWAAGRVLGAAVKGRARVIIGKDTRVSGYMLESALEAGLSAAGVDVSLLGPMPTPAIAHLTRTLRAHAGVVISASHNSYEDNGIKFFSREGTKIPDEVEVAIENAMAQTLEPAGSEDLGKADRVPDAPSRYVEYCKSTVPYRMTLDGLKVALDCANGAAYHVAPDVFMELGANVVTIGDEPDGFNINRRCGSTHPEQLQRLVIDSHADVGIAFDGDADRVIMVDRHGSLVDGDQILYILSNARKQSGTLAGGIVGTMMTNLGLEQSCAERDIPFMRAAVGDRHVLAMLMEKGWLLGGESSGHIICLDKSTTGDGIIAALEVLSVMVNSGRPLGELYQGMQVYPQRMINVRTAEPFDPDGSEAVREAVRQAQHELGTAGRVLLRRSGTEPVVRVMVEGSDPALVDRLSASLAESVRSAAEGAA